MISFSQPVGDILTPNLAAVLLEAYVQTLEFWDLFRFRRESPYRNNRTHEEYRYYKPYTKDRKVRSADDAETRCEHALEYGETIDIFAIA